MPKIKELEHWLKLQPGELRDLVIATLVLTFCFAYRWEGPRTFSVWASNFILVFILVILSVAVHEIAHRWLAKKYLARVRSKLFLSGVLAALVLVFLSNGYFIFTALWAITITSIYTYRPGRPYPEWHLGPYERAKIAVVGPIANFILALIAKLFVPVFGQVAEKLVLINVWIAAVNLFPFFTLLPIVVWQKLPKISKSIQRGTPFVEGEYVFFGSRPIWIFTFIFVIVGGLGLIYGSLLFSLILAFLVAFGIYLVWFFWVELEAKELKKLTK